MIWIQTKTLLKKDLYLFIRRKQFMFFAAVVFLSTAVCLISGFVDFNHRHNSYSNWRQVQSQTLSALEMAWSLRGPGYTQSFEPTPLSILSFGAEDLITSSFETREWTKQFFGNLQYNPFLTPFIPRFDAAMLILIIMPVLLIFLLNDFCREEFEQKTFLTCKMFGVPTIPFLLSKIISTFFPIFFTICLSVGCCFIVIANVSTFVDSLLLRYVLFCAATGIYILFWTALLLMTQILIRHSLRSIVTSISIWVCIVFVLPTIHLNSTQQIETKGSMAEYLKEKKKIYLQKAESYSYFDEINDKTDQDPFGAYGGFLSLIEEEILNFNNHSLNARTTFDHGVQNSWFAKLSPTFMTGLILSDLSASGLLDYVNFRQDMANYFRHFKSVFKRPEVVDWIRSNTKDAPLETLKSLDQPHNRVSFSLTLANVLPLMLVLLLNSLAILFLYFGVSMLSLRSLGDQK